MNIQARQLKLGALTRRLILPPAFVVALSLAFAGVASAQQGTPFQASVRGFVQKPTWRRACRR